MRNNEQTKREYISHPLLKQSIKSNLTLWLVLAIGSAAIFIIINLVIGTRRLFTSIDMNKVMIYVKDEDMSWLQILGLLETMGFSLSRIQIMSQIDMNSIINDLVYKIAGVLLPMIYVMIVCNKLVAASVSDGSMAYVLSTPTNRRTVIRTQYLFMVISLFAMYVVIFVGAIISALVAHLISRPVGVKFSATALRTLLYTFGSFAAMFALTGICFAASCWFNKSNQSTAVGGGACVIAFICCILGLFGSKVFVAVGVGVEAMNIFNFLTIYTLVDTSSITDFVKVIFTEGALFNASNLAWIWKLAILFAIGGILPIIGSIKFLKKDLPL